MKENGKLATDLHPYLGAAAHAVFINTATLDYVHVHPMVKGAADSMHMDMNGDEAMQESHSAQSGPQMVMQLPALPQGTYKMWLQFKGGSTLYTVPFTIAAR